MRVVGLGMGFLDTYVGDIFVNQAKIDRVACPVFIVHGLYDDIVPVEHGKVRGAPPSTAWEVRPLANHEPFGIVHPPRSAARPGPGEAAQASRRAAVPRVRSQRHCLHLPRRFFWRRAAVPGAPRRRQPALVAQHGRLPAMSSEGVAYVYHTVQNVDGWHAQRPLHVRQAESAWPAMHARSAAPVDARRRPAVFPQTSSCARYRTTRVSRAHAQPCCGVADCSWVGCTTAPAGGISSACW